MSSVSQTAYSKRHPLFWFSFTYVILARFYLDKLKDRMLEKGEKENATPLSAAVAKTFGLIHSFGWWMSVIYLGSMEFGHLYCDGETILSHYLRKFARFLTSYEKYGHASRVMRFVVFWNELWCGKDARFF